MSLLALDSAVIHLDTGAALGSGWGWAFGGALPAERFPESASECPPSAIMVEVVSEAVMPGSLNIPAAVDEASK